MPPPLLLLLCLCLCVCVSLSTRAAFATGLPPTDLDALVPASAFSLTAADAADAADATADDATSARRGRGRVAPAAAALHSLPHARVLTLTHAHDGGENPTTAFVLPLARRPLGGAEAEGRRRRRELHHDTAPFKEVAKVAREGDGVYWTTLKIGNPLQAFSAIVDTGSTTIAVPCKGCACGNHRMFDPSKSDTIQDTGSMYSQCYSEGSCNRGRIYRDVVCFGEGCVHNETVKHSFGCCTQYAKAFQEQEADGIVGVSADPGATLLAELRKLNDLKQNQFALCLGRTKGYLTVGGISLTPTLEPLAWTPLVNPDGTFYTVALETMSLGSTAFDVNARPIIDSGSSFTYVPKYVHDKLKAGLAEFCNANTNKCRGTKNPPGTRPEDVRDSVVCVAPPPGVVTPDQVDAWLTSDFPAFQLRFPGINAGTHVTACISPRSYFWLSTPSANAYCFGVFPDSKFVIGAITLAEFTVAFDADTKRVGFARSDCDGDGQVEQICCPGRTCAAPKASTGAPTSLPTPATAQPTPPLVLTSSPVTGMRLDTATTGPTPPPTHTRTPTLSPPKDFWEGNVGMISGYFFFLGAFSAFFVAGAYWLCCGGRRPPPGTLGITPNVPRRGAAGAARVEPVDADEGRPLASNMAADNLAPPSLPPKPSHSTSTSNSNGSNSNTAAAERRIDNV